MSVAIAAAYVVSAAGIIAAVSLGRDRRIPRRLGVSIARPAQPLLGRVGARATYPLPAMVLERAAEVGLEDEDLSSLRGRKLILGLVGALTGASVGMPAAIALAPVLGVAAFRLPDLGLARAVARRRREIAGAVPQLLDVLAVSVSAGLSPRLALDRAHQAVPGPLRSELRRASDDVALGEPWRRVLRGLAERSRSADLRRLAVTLDRSERIGSPVGERLQALARDVRSERRSRREERAHRAPIQMLFPLVFLILPAFVLAAVVPAVLVATRGLT